MKKKLLGLLTAGVLAVSVLSSVTALADGSKVVTLGADLSEEQRTAILKYFGVLGQNIETLYITNQDERAHLGSYIPLEQIGTRTFSCALVNPTNSGGIQVKTANLNYVTGNMIATTLSTCGVVNCEVLAASPFEVSGTGALTGIIMAYEDAMGQKLDNTKKDIATQELVTTTTIANQVGQDEATNIVNEIKIQVIEGQVVDPQEVEEIVDEVVEQSVTVELSPADRELLNDLANRIAEQQYDYEDVRETLERVEQNVTVNVNVQTGDTNVNNENNNSNTSTNHNDNSSSSTSTNTNENNNNASSSSDSSSQSSAEQSQESILNQADSTALGDNVITTTTVEETTVQEAAPQNTAPADDTPAIDIVNETSEVFGGDAASQPAPSEQPAQEPIVVEEPAQEPVIVEEPAQEPAPSEQPAQESIVVEEPAQEPVIVEEPAQEPVVVEEPAQEPVVVEEPAQEPVVEEPAAPVVEALTFDQSNVRIIPSEQADNVSGLNVLRIQVAVPRLEMTTADDGSFGYVSVSSTDETTVISLQDANDPASADGRIVAVRPMSGDTLAQNGWADGTEFFINLGDALDTNVIDLVYIDVVGLTLVRKDDTGAVIAKGSLTQSVVSGTDEIGLTFDDCDDIADFTAGNTVQGHVIVPDTAEEEGVSYSATIETNDNTVFTMNDDTSFTAVLGNAGTSAVTVNVSNDGGETFIPYTFNIAIIPAQ